MSYTRPPADRIRLHLRSPEATEALARRIAPDLRPGDTILLSGPVGAGKSHFARAVIHARLADAGRHEDVPSPTFTLVQQYDDGLAEIWHADLYRLSHPDEAAELGLEEAFGSAICLVEWPDRLGPFQPPGALWLSLVEAGDDPDARCAELASDSPRWGALLAGLPPDFSGRPGQDDGAAR